MDMFKLIALMSGICLGIRAITDTGKIGYPLRVFIVGTFGDFAAKPLITCATCMASFWGSIVFWTYWLCSGLKINYITFLLWIAAVLVTAFVNELFWSLNKKLQR